MCANLHLREHQNYNYLLNNHLQEDAGTYQKKLQGDGRRGIIMIKSKPICTG